MKTKRTLIISAAIMALALVVTLVGVSAAWFGDIKHRETQRQLYVTSAHPMGEATIDLDSATRLNDGSQKLVPAKVKTDANGISWLLAGNYMLTGDVRPEGDILRPSDGTSVANVKPAATSAITSAASVVPVYFPFSYGGTADSGVPDGKKAVKIYIDSAYLTSNNTVDTTKNYLDEFYMTFTVVKDVVKNQETGVITCTAVTSATATKDGEGNITFNNLSSLDDSIYFVNDVDGDALYLLVPPDVDKYSVKVSISYKYLDEELNPATINKTIKFGVHIEVIERAALLTAITPLIP